MPNGKAIEGCPFHHDGQNFAKAYEIKFSDENGNKQFVWQNTYAISTRMLGVMFAVHSDDKGLIIPPKVAPIQIVIIPILFPDSQEKVLKKAKEIKDSLKEYSVYIDDRENYKPGFKFNDYELKGVPLRIELGPRDLEKSKVIVARRDTSEKEEMKISEVKKRVPALLESIQENLFKRSEKLFKSKIEKASSLKELIKVIDNKQVGIVPMCKSEECEDSMKSETKGAKALFIADAKTKTEKCIICGKKADYFIYAGKSY